MPATPTIKAVVFDFDGLMFNTEEIFNLSGRELLRRRGKEMTPALLSLMMGRRSDEAFPMMIEALGLTEDPDALRARNGPSFTTCCGSTSLPCRDCSSSWPTSKPADCPKASPPHRVARISSRCSANSS